MSEKPLLSKRFREMVLAIRDVIKRSDDDYVVLIFGQEGVGKSTLSLDIALTLTDYNFNFEHIYATTDDLIRFLSYLKEATELKKSDRRAFEERYAGTVHIFDEGQNILNRRRAMEKINKIVDEIFKNVRYLQQIYIINSPVLNDLDTSLLRRSDMVLFIPKRGVFWAWFGRQKENFVYELEEKRAKTRYTPYQLIVGAETKPALIGRFRVPERKYVLEYEKRKAVNLEEFISNKIAELYGKYKKTALLELGKAVEELGLTKDEIKQRYKNAIIVKDGKEYVDMTKIKREN